MITQLHIGYQESEHRIEIYNPSDNAIDLGGYVLDDANGTILPAANISGGTIAAHETAVLYAAGTPPGSIGSVNYKLIPVEHWTSIELTKEGPWTLSLWENYGAYVGDSTTHADSIDTIPYDLSNGFPSQFPGAITLNSVAVDNSIGENWSATLRFDVLGEAPVPGLVAPTLVHGSESGRSASFALRLTARPESDVVLNVTSADPSEVSVPETVVISPNNWRNVYVPYTGLTDGELDGSQAVPVTFTVNTDGSSDEFDSIQDVSVDIVIRDLDFATLSISSPTVPQSGTTADFVISLSQPTDVEVTAFFSTVGDTAEAGIDFTALTDYPVVFSPGETSVVVSVAVSSGHSTKTFSGRVNELVSNGRNILLDEPFRITPPVLSFLDTPEFAPDSGTIVYIADHHAKGVAELYSIPAAGGDPVRLNDPLQSDRRVKTFAITPDGTTVVYASDREGKDRFELYSVPIGGGTPTKLNPPLAANQDAVNVSGFAVPPLISSDSKHVVYRIHEVTETGGDHAELYSVPIGGGDSIQLLANANVLAPPSISPDGTSVLFIAEVGSTFGRCLYQVPIDGGTADALSPVLSGTYISHAEYTPDGETVVYIDRNNAVSGGLFEVPTTGGDATGINVALEANWKVINFVVSPDSSAVAYRISHSSQYISEVVLSSLTGNAGVVASLSIGYAAATLHPLAPDGFLAIIHDDPGELWKFSVSSGFFEQLSTPSESARVVAVSSDGSSAYYSVRFESAIRELRAVPTDGGESRIVNIPISNNGVLASVLPSPDNTIVSYTSRRLGGGESLYGAESFQTGTATIVGEPDFLVTGPVGRTEEKRPQLSWESVTNATSYDVWINLDGTGVNVFRHLNIDGGNTSLDLPHDLEFGRYRVFVTARFADGESLDSQGHTFIVDRKSETVAVGATTETNPTLSWQRVPGATSYKLFVNNPGAPVIEDVVDSNSASTGTISHQLSTALAGNDYRWWVRPVRDNGWMGPWSDASEFSTGGRTKVSSPARGAEVGSTPEISWPAVPDAQAYEVYVSQTGSAGALFRDHGIVSTSYPSRVLRNGDYRVWIRTTLSDGSSVWGGGAPFTVSEPTSESSTVPIQPNGAGLSTLPSFVWRPTQSAASYDVYLHNGTTAFLETGITATSWTPSQPLAIGAWSWTVRPVGAAGNGLWSDEVHFNTNGRTTLLSPAATTSSLPTFTWNTVAGAATYSLQVDNLTTSESGVIRRDDLIDSSFTPADSLPPGRYRAWVRAINGGIRGVWSTERDFEIV